MPAAFESASIFNTHTGCNKQVANHIPSSTQPQLYNVVWIRWNSLNSENLYRTQWLVLYSYKTKSSWQLEPIKECRDNECSIHVRIFQDRERISVRVGGHCRERPHTKTLLIPIDYWCTTAWHSIHRQLLIGAFCICGVNPLPACWQCPLFDWGHSGLAGSGEIEGVRTDRFSPQVWVVVGRF